MKLVYFIYLVKKTKWTTLFELAKYVGKLQSKNSFLVLFRMLHMFFKYNTAFIDYFYLELYKKPQSEIATYLDTLYMFRFQRKKNNKDFVHYFKDKKAFYKKFRSYISHEYFLPKSRSTTDFKTWLDTNCPEAIITKNSKGQVGKGIQKIQVKYKNEVCYLNDNRYDEYYKILLTQKTDIIDVNIKQHPLLASFHSNSLNTIRVITLIDKNKKVNILGTILRMGVNHNFIDNFDAGGISAVVNKSSGIIEGPLVFKDPRMKLKKDGKHPTTDAQVLGVQLPFWNELIKLIEKLVLVVPEAKTIGWDIAIGINGPILIEGNHNWDKTHWQKAYKKGMKEVLNRY